MPHDCSMVARGDKRRRLIAPRHPLVREPRPNRRCPSGSARAEPRRLSGTRAGTRTIGRCHDRHPAPVKPRLRPEAYPSTAKPSLLSSSSPRSDLGVMGRLVRIVSVGALEVTSKSPTRFLPSIRRATV